MSGAVHGVRRRTWSPAPYMASGAVRGVRRVAGAHDRRLDRGRHHRRSLRCRMSAERATAANRASRQGRSRRRHPGVSGLLSAALHHRLPFNGPFNDSSPGEPGGTLAFFLHLSQKRTFEDKQQISFLSPNSDEALSAALHHRLSFNGPSPGEPGGTLAFFLHLSQKRTLEDK